MAKRKAKMFLVPSFGTNSHFFAICATDIKLVTQTGRRNLVYEYANELKQAALPHTALDYHILTHRPT